MTICREPLITIITSTFNEELLLGDTIESIRNSSYRSIEYIVVDGASIDGTVDVIKCSLDVVTSYISEPDVGIYDAWNKALAISSGEYISFLGAGDRYVDDGLRKLVDVALGDLSIQFVSTNHFLRGADSEIPSNAYGSRWEWNKFRRYNCISHHGALYSMKYFHEHGFFNTGFKISGDYEMLLRAGAELRAEYVDAALVEAVPGGISQRNFRVVGESFNAKIKNGTVKWGHAYLYALMDFLSITKKILRNIISVGK